MHGLGWGALTRGLWWCGNQDDRALLHHSLASSAGYWQETSVPLDVGLSQTCWRVLMMSWLWLAFSRANDREEELGRGYPLYDLISESSHHFFLILPKRMNHSVQPAFEGSGHKRRCANEFIHILNLLHI